MVRRGKDTLFLAAAWRNPSGSRWSDHDSYGRRIMSDRSCDKMISEVLQNAKKYPTDPSFSCNTL